MYKHKCENEQSPDSLSSLGNSVQPGLVQLLFNYYLFVFIC